MCRIEKVSKIAFADMWINGILGKEDSFSKDGEPEMSKESCKSLSLKIPLFYK